MLMAGGYSVSLGDHGNPAPRRGPQDLHPGGACLTRRPARRVGRSQPRQEVHLIIPAHLHQLHIRSGFLVQALVSILGRTQLDPGSDSNVVEDLKQPFDVALQQREAPTGLAFVPPVGVNQKQVQLPFVLPALLGQGLLEQSLVSGGIRHLPALAQGLVGRGQARIAREYGDQHEAFRQVEMKLDRGALGSQALHPSRSMVACRVYCWSRCT